MRSLVPFPSYRFSGTMAAALCLALFTVLCATVQAQDVFTIKSPSVKIYVDSIYVNEWLIDPDNDPDIFEAEIRKHRSRVEYRDSLNTISFMLEVGQTIDFSIIDNKGRRANQRIIGVKPNVVFTDTYIAQNKGKWIVDIPEVSELVNIIMVLHKDAEKDENMFDTKTEYYKRIRSFFEPYKHHAMIDTIQRYISGLHLMKDLNAWLFSDSSYRYYYAMKMNACAYSFDDKGMIRNTGAIQEMAKGWCPADPMKDLELIQDFAQRSNFRAFYRDNKPYYDSLLEMYSRLNPLQKMQSWLDTKFGFSYGSYKVYFSPLVYGAHSTQKFSDNGFEQTIMFVARAEMNSAESTTMNELLESRVVFTEIDHNYVNPVSDTFRSAIDSAFSNRDIWARGQQASWYRNPYMVFNEYMTFAVYSLYILDNYGEITLDEFLPKMVKQMESRGFIAFKDFTKTLIHLYQKDKNQPMSRYYAEMLGWAKLRNTARE
jgi:hypothetical protein